MRAVFDARSANMPPKFVSRERKHKVIARRKAASSSRDGAIVDANSEEILPKDQQERKDKAAALKDELIRESQGKVTGKKKKRLDKYIVRLSIAWSDSRRFL
jgi:ATP-dependent RNA helicase DHX37/DHR1